MIFLPPPTAAGLLQVLQNTKSAACAVVLAAIRIRLHTSQLLFYFILPLVARQRSVSGAEAQADGSSGTGYGAPGSCPGWSQHHAKAKLAAVRRSRRLRVLSGCRILAQKQAPPQRKEATLTGAGAHGEEEAMV